MSDSPARSADSVPIIEWAPVCKAKFDSARLLREFDVSMQRPYTCTRELGHEGMHWDESAEALWGSDWTARNDGPGCGADR